MNPRVRRLVIPIVVAGLALSVVTVMMTASARKRSQPPPAEAVPDAAAAADTADPAAPGDAPVLGTDPADAVLDTTPRAAFEGLRAKAIETAIVPALLGSLDPAVAPALVELSKDGAGIARITLADIWETSAARRQADRHAANPTEVPLPDPSLRYVLAETQRLRNSFRGDGIDVPILAANRIEVNGTPVNLFSYNVREDGTHEPIWAVTGPGRFETTVIDADDTPVLRITRLFTLGPTFDIEFAQMIENLTDAPIDVKWIQYGPGSLRVDRSRYMDRRRYRFGYLLSPEKNPDRTIVLADDNDLLVERRTLLKRWEKAAKAIDEGDDDARRQNMTQWPNRPSENNAYELSWFASTNRYFGLAVHPNMETGTKSLAPVVEEIIHEVSIPDPFNAAEDSKIIFTYLLSPEKAVVPGATLSLDLGVYAGPLDRHVLDEPPYDGLALDKLVLFQMSSFCAICTFQWLAHLLLNLLTVFHDYVLFDWGLAIITLVIMVRLILHPLVKRSQISMQRFGKVMSGIKPELDKLQKKFPDDPKRLQQEQMRMMREQGVNPLHMLGCLPMFLQTPIWIALYAMLYFAFDLRQVPAFFGIFQHLTNDAWPFLADLSAADHFFGELAEPTRFLMWNITGINLLPFLMGAVFFFQQKYMSPPPSPSMTPEQIKQQKIMKVMMVVLFPLMLYSAPSGLTMYILTSSCIGVLESRYIRRHVDEMDLKPKKPKKRAPVKPKDKQGRAFAEAMKRVEERKRAKLKGPPKRYKKRK